MRVLLSAALVLGALTHMATADAPKSALDFKAKSIKGEMVNLSDYEGDVVLVVNTASRCGFTRQYAGLQQLYTKLKHKGFVVLGFPCNQFGSQEPGSDQQIAEFCSTNFKVSFPMFSKIDVNGSEAAPMYKYLTGQDLEPAGKGDISWNFEKFLIDRSGKVVHRFAPSTKPYDDSLVKAIDQALAKK